MFLEFWEKFIGILFKVWAVLFAIVMTDFALTPLKKWITLTIEKAENITIGNDFLIYPVSSIRDFKYIQESAHHGEADNSLAV